MNEREKDRMKKLIAKLRGTLEDIQSHTKHLEQEIRDTHSQLDFMEVPRIIGEKKDRHHLTLFGRMDWLREQYSIAQYKAFQKQQPIIHESENQNDHNSSTTRCRNFYEKNLDENSDSV